MGLYTWCDGVAYRDLGVLEGFSCAGCILSAWVFHEVYGQLRHAFSPSQALLAIRDISFTSLLLAIGLEHHNLTFTSAPFKSQPNELDHSQPLYFRKSDVLHSHLRDPESRDKHPCLALLGTPAHPRFLISPAPLLHNSLVPAFHGEEEMYADMNCQ
jgi:hypothetical protein